MLAALARSVASINSPASPLAIEHPHGVDRLPVRLGRPSVRYLCPRDAAPSRRDAESFSSFRSQAMPGSRRTACATARPQ